MKPSIQSVFFGLIAILLWASLATLGNLLIHLPPFYVLGVAFLIGSVPSWTKPRKMFVSWKESVWGIVGYFCYHFFLFYSFRYAPPIEANLINYLWPMLMVIMTPIFFSNSSLKWFHFIGAGLSAAGGAVLVWSKGADLKFENMAGYLLALAAAISWPVYSLVKKKLASTSVFSIGGICFVTGILCLVTHSLIEPRVVLQLHDFWIILLMGLGPCGLAFYAWDLAIKLGDTRVIGALSYLTPVLSTLLLVIFGGQTIVLATLVAMVLITGGASCGLLDFLPKKDRLN